MLKAIVLLVVLIVVVHALKTPCGCGCWRWQNCQSKCCVTGESMSTRFENRTITLHATSSCSHCVLMKPVWARVMADCADTGIVFKEVDEDKTPTPGIEGYPTIRMQVTNSAYPTMYEYKGGPNYNNLRAWVLTPVPQ